MPVVKNPPANAGDTRDAGLMPESVKSPREGNGSSSLAWEIPKTEEPDGLQSMGLQRVRHNGAHMHTHMFTIPLAI